jgi:hypothetical protein
VIGGEGGRQRDAVTQIRVMAATYLGLLERGVCAGLEVSEIREDTFLKLFHVDHGAAECLEAEDEGTNDVGAGDVVEAVPKNARDILSRGEEKAVEGGVLGLGLWLLRGIRRCPAGRGGGEEELEAVELGKEILFLRVEGAGNLLLRLLLSGLRGGLDRVGWIHVSGRWWRWKGKSGKNRIRIDNTP